MVLSLAFILAFVGSAVVLVIGILIFSDVTEAMSLTLPILIAENVGIEQNSRDGSTEISNDRAHLPSTYSNLTLSESVIGVTLPILGINEDDGVWFAREHCIGACGLFENRVQFENFIASISYADAFSFNVFTGGGTSTDGYLGKVFLLSEIANKEITISTSQNGFKQAGMIGRIYDGVLDPLPTGACGLDCFPHTTPVVTSASGGFVTLWTNPTGTGSFVNVSNSTLAGFDSPTGKVTLVVVSDDQVSIRQVRSNVQFIDIQDTGTFTFSSDPADPLWSGTFSVLKIRDSLQGGSVPEAYELWASRPPIVCDYDIGVYDSSNNLLASGQGMVNFDIPQDIRVDFANPVPIPNDGIISVGIVGEQIRYEGSTDLTDFDDNIGSSLPDPFVTDGTVGSSQTTILITEFTNSESSLSAHDSFNSALNIGFTVIGIIPVALFFFLFAIFSGRGME